MSILDAHPAPKPGAHWPDGFRERAQAIADRVALTRATEAQARELAAQCEATEPIMATGLRRLANQLTITPESSGQERERP